ncbi:MAG TPA: ATP-binding cassette domain-containing protein [Anaeromyxobacter sp.]|nr:ATP-binding cassette domain-containing protein [Anaeromyxobacter sp.]
MDPILEIHGWQLSADGGGSIDLRLFPGELLVLVGEGQGEGAALLRAAAGLCRPRRGTVRVLGQDPAALPRAAREALSARLGYLPRRGELLSNISLEANLLLPLAYHHRLGPAAAALAGQRTAARFGLPWPLPDALPAEVPLTLRRRVALARALVLEPELLLLDDFTDDLSRSDGGAMADAIRAYVVARRAAVLAASDDPTLADRLGARRQTLEA